LDFLFFGLFETPAPVTKFNYMPLDVICCCCYSYNIPLNAAMYLKCIATKKRFLIFRTS